MTRDYVGRLLAIDPSGQVDVKLYLKADVGFGITMHAVTIQRRFPLLNIGIMSQAAQAVLAERAMDRNITIRSHKCLDKHDEYVVELLDINTGVNHTDVVRGL